MYTLIIFRNENYCILYLSTVGISLRGTFCFTGISRVFLVCLFVRSIFLRSIAFVELYNLRYAKCSIRIHTHTDKHTIPYHISRFVKWIMPYFFLDFVVLYFFVLLFFRRITMKRSSFSPLSKRIIHFC